MHAFQHRPAASSTESVFDREWAHGFFYIARQKKLVFGHKRYSPVEWRPVVSLLRDGDAFYVLPGTTRPNPAFFRITSQNVLRKQTPPDDRDTYLCPRYEALQREYLSEKGVLHHPVRIQLMTWLRQGKTTSPG